MNVYEPLCNATILAKTRTQAILHVGPHVIAHIIPFILPHVARRESCLRSGLRYSWLSLRSCPRSSSMAPGILPQSMAQIITASHHASDNDLHIVSSQIVSFARYPRHPDLPVRSNVNTPFSPTLWVVPDVLPQVPSAFLPPQRIYAQPGSRVNGGHANGCVNEGRVNDGRGGGEGGEGERKGAHHDHMGPWSTEPRIFPGSCRQQVYLTGVTDVTLSFPMW